MRKVAAILIIASIALVGLGLYLLIGDSDSSGDVAAVEEALGTDEPVVLGPEPTPAISGPGWNIQEGQLYEGAIEVRLGASINYLLTGSMENSAIW